MQFNFVVLLALVVCGLATSDVSAGRKGGSYGLENEARHETDKDPGRTVHVNCGSGSAAMMVAMMKKLNKLTEKVAVLSAGAGSAGPPGPPGPQGSPGTGGGTAYVRYGRTKCPSTSDLVYAGSVAGSPYNHRGGGTDYLCLRQKFQWNKYTNANDGSSSYLYGTEYQETINSKFFSMKHARSFYNYNVPCALCHTPARGARIMIAGGRLCENGWTKEYEGYLVADYHTHNSKQFVCLDEAPEVIAGSHVNKDGALMYKVQAACPGSELPCTVGYREVTCVVCTK